MHNIHTFSLHFMAMFSCFRGKQKTSNSNSHLILVPVVYTSQSPSVSESASASESSVNRKVPIGLCVSSYIYLSTSVIFDDIHPHPNITKLNPFYIRILTSEGSLKGCDFLICCPIFALKVSFFSALTAACTSTKIVT